VGDSMTSPGDDFATRADLHRPTDPVQLAAEIRRLADSGLTARDIGAALRIGLGQVLEALRREDRA
jgi:hypothetical protein